MEQEIKAVLDAQGRAWEEFKRTNDERIRQEAKGVADPLITEKLARINEDIDKRQDAINAILANVQSDLKRLALAGGEKGEGLTLEQREYRQALQSYMRKGRDSGLRDLEAKAMSAGSNEDGGYMVLPDTSGRVVQRIFELSPVRQFATVQPISTDRLEGQYEVDEAGGGWVAETGSRSDSTTPQVQKWAIQVHEQHASPKATQALLEDASVDVEMWLAGKVERKFARLEAAAFVTGDGAGKPRGFASYTTATTADDTRAWGTFQHVATGTSGSLGTDPNGVQKLIDLMFTLKPDYLGAARWFMNRTTLAAVRKLTDASSAGKFVFVPSFVAGVPDTLLGYPVTVCQDMASYSTANALSVAFGDMGEAYQIVDRRGITVLRDPFTAKPYVVFYTTRRVGGDVVNFDALKFLKSA